MLLIVLEYVSGLIIAIAGFVSVYIYFKSLERDLLLLGGSAFSVIIGMLLLIYAAKRHSKVIQTHREKSSNDPSIMVQTKNVNLLKKNNELISQWKKTEDTRDRLKLLQLSAEANGE